MTNVQARMTNECRRTNDEKRQQDFTIAEHEAATCRPDPRCRYIRNTLPNGGNTMKSMKNDNGRNRG